MLWAGEISSGIYPEKMKLGELGRGLFQKACKVQGGANHTAGARFPKESFIRTQPCSPRGCFCVVTTDCVAAEPKMFAIRSLAEKVCPPVAERKDCRHRGQSSLSAQGESEARGAQGARAVRPGEEGSSTGPGQGW